MHRKFANDVNPNFITNVPVREKHNNPTITTETSKENYTKRHLHSSKRLRISDEKIEISVNMMI